MEDAPWLRSVNEVLLELDCRGPNFVGTTPVSNIVSIVISMVWWWFGFSLGGVWFRYIYFEAVYCKSVNVLAPLERRAVMMRAMIFNAFCWFWSWSKFWVLKIDIIFLFRSFAFSWFLHCATLVCLLLEGAAHVGLQIQRTSSPDRLTDTVCSDSTLMKVVKGVTAGKGETSGTFFQKLNSK